MRRHDSFVTSRDWPSDCLRPGPIKLAPVNRLLEGTYEDAFYKSGGHGTRMRISFVRSLSLVMSCLNLVPVWQRYGSHAMAHVVLR